MNKMLVVIDLEKSFINENTIFVIDKINDLINSGKFDKIIFTKFVNFEDSLYVKVLNYRGCMTNEEKQIMIDTRNNIVLEKSIYTIYSSEFKSIVDSSNIDEIYLCGIDTECCVLKSAFDLFEKGYKVKVLKDYCASLHGEERHNRALDILRRNIGYENVI